MKRIESTVLLALEWMNYVLWHTIGPPAFNAGYIKTQAGSPTTASKSVSSINWTTPIYILNCSVITSIK